jgi:hypothetical protein
MTVAVATAIVLALPAVSSANTCDTCGGGGGGDPGAGDPPTVEITDGPPSLTNSPNPSFTFTAHEDPAATGLAFKCSMDSAAPASFATCSSPKSGYSVPGNGQHIFRVKASDTNGTGPVTTYTWTVDVEWPDSSIAPQFTTSGGYSTSHAASFLIGGSDNVGVDHVDCKLSGPSQTAVFTNCGANGSLTSYTGLADGTYTFSARAADTAGNHDGSPASFTWTVDTTAPDTQIDSGPTADSTSTQNTFTFGFSSPSVDTASFLCTLTGPTGQAQATCASPRLYSSLADGQYRFEVAASDHASNIDQTPATRTWTVDSNPPSVPANITQTDSSRTSASVSWSASTDTIGVAGYEVFLNGVSAGTTTAPNATLGGLGCGGAYGIAVAAFDAAGNHSARSATVSLGTAACPPSDQGSSGGGVTGSGTGPPLTVPTLLASGAATQRVLKQKAVIVTATSTQAGFVQASGTIKVSGKKKPLPLVANRQPDQPGQAVTLRLALSKKRLAAVRKALRKRKKVSATVTVMATDSAGNSAPATEKIKLRR